MRSPNKGAETCTGPTLLIIHKDSVQCNVSCICFDKEVGFQYSYVVCSSMLGRDTSWFGATITYCGDVMSQEVSMVGDKKDMFLGVGGVH